MNTLIFRIAAVLLLSVASLFSLNEVSADQTDTRSDQEDTSKPAVVTQDERAARAADIALMAKDTGYPIAAVEQAVAFQEAFGNYADDLLERYPNQISSVRTEPLPSALGYIQFVKDVPAEVIEELSSDRALNLSRVILTGDGKYSMEENFRRAELASAALMDLGYRNSITFFDPVSKKIQVEVLLSAQVLRPSESGIVNAMRSRIQTDQQKAENQLQGRAAEFDTADLVLTIFTGEGPIVTLLHSRGGNWLRDDGVNECTSGWSVSGPNGDGIITAGHCNGLNQFVEPGVAPYSMTWRSQVINASGDVEYHTTSHIEPDDFYSDATTIRDVTGIKTTNTMVGSAVCFYGRASNVRTCDHEIEAIDVNVMMDGTLVGDQARASNDSAIGGDSGGGWSVGNTAWGVQSSHDNNDNSYFTPVQQAQTALGVTVKTN